MRLTACRPAAVLLSALALAPGCGGPQTDGAYAEAYQAGRYEEARRAASREADRSRGEQAERARLYEGLAAHAEGDSSAAQLALEPLTGSRDDEIAGRAGATVGLIAFERGRFDKAARYLSEAADRLDGADAVRARTHAALAYEELGRGRDAAEQRALAMAAGESAGRWDGGSVSHHNGAYTVQLGAFSDRARAARLARMSRGLARARGFGEPEIVLSRGSAGETLYLVQIGRFDSKGAAERARAGLDVESVVADAPVN